MEVGSVIQKQGDVTWAKVMAMEIKREIGLFKKSETLSREPDNSQGVSSNGESSSKMRSYEVAIS